MALPVQPMRKEPKAVTVKKDGEIGTIVEQRTASGSLVIVLY